MLKQLAALARGFVGIPPLSLTLLGKARDLRMRNVSKHSPYQHLLPPKAAVMQWRLMFRLTVRWLLILRCIYPNNDRHLLRYAKR